MNEEKLIAVDYEFSKPSELGMGLMCVATHCREDGTMSWWLRDSKEKASFSRYIAGKRKEKYTMVAYAVQLAEARCIAALGVDPNTFIWRDVYEEWKWLRNHDDRYNYGAMMKSVNANFYIERFSVPPKVRIGKKASQTEIDDAKEVNSEYLEDIAYEIGVPLQQLSNEQLGFSLLDCMFSFEVLNKFEFKDAIDQKKFIRDEIIIKGDDAKHEEYRAKILSYCQDDVKDLLTLANKTNEAMCKIGAEEHYVCLPGGKEQFKITTPAEITEIQHKMGAWAARLAKYAYRGIPLHRGRLDKLLEIIPVLKAETKANWNTEHPLVPLYRVGQPLKILEGRKTMAKKSPYTKDGDLMVSDDFMKQKMIEDHATLCNIEWPKTKSGKFDTSSKIIQRYAAGENIIKQYERLKNTENTFRVYSPAPNGEVKALRYIGSDDRQRPDFNPLGTQTARNGAKATSFCLLGAHWVRVLINPEEDTAIVALDYGSQEVFIAAAMSGDKAMKEAYLAPDTYIYYAQQIGMYPKDLPVPTEEQRGEDWFKPHKKTRTVAKVLNLSMQFGAGAEALASAVRDATKNPDTGEVDESIDKAWGKERIEEYKDTYPFYADMVDTVKKEYKDHIPLMLQNGWRLGKDNPSPNSIANLPIQGTAAIMLQEACRLADEAGLKAIATLHDEILFECKISEIGEVSKLGRKAMLDASFNILGEHGMKVGAPEVIKHGDLYLHSDKAKRAWNSLSQYFEGLY